MCDWFAQVVIGGVNFEARFFSCDNHYPKEMKKSVAVLPVSMKAFLIRYTLPINMWGVCSNFIE